MSTPELGVARVILIAWQNHPQRAVSDVLSAGLKQIADKKSGRGMMPALKKT